MFSSIDLYENTLSFFFLIRICAESHWVPEKPHVSNHRAISTIHVCIEIESFPFRDISLNRKKGDVLYWSALYSKANVRIGFCCCFNTERKNTDMGIVGKTLEVRYVVK